MVMHEGVRLYPYHEKIWMEIPEVGSGSTSNLYQSPGYLGQERSFPLFHQGVVPTVASGQKPRQEPMV